MVIVSRLNCHLQTSVYVPQFSANHSTRNFIEPDSSLAEPWLGHELFASDKLTVLNPFSFGPRNGVGKK